VFEGFALERIGVGEVTLRVRHGGSGPAVLLLHGHPRTHATWHKVAPLLVAAGHTVVCPDLRGYGESSKPEDTPDHASYSKGAMAQDCVELMSKLGHERFAVVGHDRGAHVAQRLALDHLDVVERAAFLDTIPIGEALSRCGPDFAQRWWQWFFLGQTAKPAELAINADPDGWYRIDPSMMGQEAYEDLRRALNDPATVHAMCEDYRAGLTVDRHMDDEDRRLGHRIECPALLIWAIGDDLATLYGDPVAIWRAWAPHIGGMGLESGHHMAEEVPERLATVLLGFLDARQSG
jgi:haloacetate dehalogenase